VKGLSSIARRSVTALQRAASSLWPFAPMK
jgi:hypothetical protein